MCEQKWAVTRIIKTRGNLTEYVTRSHGHRVVVTRGQGDKRCVILINGRFMETTLSLARAKTRALELAAVV